MKEIIIGNNEAGQRLDKLLGKVLNQAPQGFIYKMLRKKNIKLNQKKAEGKEQLAVGDTIQIYLSDETYDKFHVEKNYTSIQSKQQRNQMPQQELQTKGYQSRSEKENKQTNIALKEAQIIFQSPDIMILNKPAGVLSQKAKSEDDSINEQMIRYLLEQGIMEPGQLRTFTPAVCNRLDRNTSGIVLAGISLAGSQELSRMLRDRSLDKYYLALVSGTMKQSKKVTAYLKKDERTNRVIVSGKKIDGGSMIETHYQPLHWNNEYTLLEVKLVTGKSHQIRAHLAYLGFPIVGDAKYGKEEVNRRFRERFGIQNQFLHAYRVVFPELTGTLQVISGKEFQAPLPGKMDRAVKVLWNN